MSSFFLPVKNGGKKPSAAKMKKQAKKDKTKSLKRPRTEVDMENRMSRRRKLMEKIEVDSDDEGSIGSATQSPIEDSGSEFEENEHDRGYREAKKLLDKLQGVSKDSEAVAEALEEDAAAKAGTLKREIADDAELRDDDEIYHRSHRFSVLAVALSPCGKFVVSSGKECSIIKYNLKERKVVGTIKLRKGSTDPHPHHGHIFAVAISPDGKYLASGGHDSILKIWNFETLEHVRDFKGQRAPITSLTFELKSNRLYSGSRDRTVRLYDLDQMGLVDTMFGHEDAVQALSVLNKSLAVTAGGRDRTCRMWKVDNESQLVFNGYVSCESIDAVAMLNDEHFVSGSQDGSLCIWSVRKKKPLTVRKLAHGSNESGEPRWITSLAAVPYSDLFASGSNDGDLKLWKVTADYKRVVQVFAYAIDGFINALKFSPHGDYLAIACGQEHRDGRWWVMKEARNQVIVLPVRYGGKHAIDDAEDSAAVVSDDDDDDDEVAEKDRLAARRKALEEAYASARSRLAARKVVEAEEKEEHDSDSDAVMGDDSDVEIIAETTEVAKKPSEVAEASDDDGDDDEEDEEEEELSDVL